ncbi:hypothetical protein [Flavobacterium sp. H122]|uniref:hypothetical protein n=1 Tax=Flavobacterium sp. H122 TaxID=2529860 RepID=UPI0010A9FA7D|nr:hypothetical protein [Flavobacterium sp. H122]
MKIVKLFFLLLCFLLISCENEKEKNEVNSLELFQLVINDLKPILSFPVLERKESENNFEYDIRFNDSLRSNERCYEKGTCVLNIYVEDTLVNSNLLFHEKKYFKKDVSNSLFKKIPKEFSETKVVNLKNLTIKKSNLVRLKEKISDEILNSNRDDKYYANVIFSNIVFNGDFTEAIFLYEYYCGSKCGYLNMVIGKKINGKWTVK